ncbi:hypothetical protein PIB30_069853 [Stylosanthes scabra]|uniref:Uncharacterized protein n=1 Tax=Stylosanthes scabra TaxID=79078 RepID=A0ABU6TN00_9FABA|nr:hypothetical protein [Stylosanthes scabra]
MPPSHPSSLFHTRLKPPLSLTSPSPSTSETTFGQPPPTEPSSPQPLFFSLSLFSNRAVAFPPPSTAATIAVLRTCLVCRTQPPPSSSSLSHTITEPTGNNSCLLHLRLTPSCPEPTPSRKEDGSEARVSIICPPFRAGLYRKGTSIRSSLAVGTKT